MTLSIMFVDESPHVLRAMKRIFRKMRHQRSLRFTTSPDEALKQLAAEPADVLITAMSFSGQSGMELLEKVRMQFPQTVRIVLSGSVSSDVVLKAADLAHQYIAKPFEEDDLISAVDRAFFVKQLLDDAPLKMLVSQISALPTLPAVYVELEAQLNTDDASMAKLGEIIAKDPAISAKLLQLANSSFFSRSQRILDPAKAVSLLGLDLVRSIVLAVGVIGGFKILIKDFSVDNLWQHAMLTAAMAGAIAKAESVDRETADAAFSAGLLHDIGKLLIVAQLPERFHAIVEQMKSDNTSMAAAEKKILGTTHAAVGAYLLGLWGLPMPIVQAVAFHHAPENNDDGLTALIIVHAANAFANTGQLLANGQTDIEELDYPYLERLGLIGHLGKWRKTCLESLEQYQ
jgi:putative nucleotidyltransferase with HDIG domain